MIDPGHGGKDSGAVGNGVVESDYVLKISNLLKSLCPNIRRTRSSNIFVPLEERSAIANRADADFFVSLHCNYYSSPSARGFEVFHAAGSTSGQQLATTLYDRIVPTLPPDMPHRGVKEANFSVLRRTNMPAALIEFGFLSNADDAAWLSKPETSYDLAAAISLVVDPTPRGSTPNKLRSEILKISDRLTKIANEL